MKTSIIIFIAALLVCVTLYYTIPNYTRRGEVVVVAGQSIGYVLAQEKGLRKHIHVIYCTSTGEWVDKWFPEEMVKPITVLKTP